MSETPSNGKPNPHVDRMLAFSVVHGMFAKYEPMQKLQDLALRFGAMAQSIASHQKRPVPHPFITECATQEDLEWALSVLGSEPCLIDQVETVRRYSAIVLRKRNGTPEASAAQDTEPTLA